MKGWGKSLLATGVLLAVISFLLPMSIESYSTSSYLPDRVINIGKLQMQMLVFQSGAVLFLAGAIFVAAGEVVDRLSGDVRGSGVSTSLDERALPEAGPAPVTPDPTPEELEQRAKKAAREARGNKYLAWGMAALLIVLLLVAFLTGRPTQDAPASFMPDGNAESHALLANITADEMSDNMTMPQ